MLIENIDINKSCYEFSNNFSGFEFYLLYYLYLFEK